MFQNMIDLFSPDQLEITIDQDGKTVWINEENGCLLRACRIKKLVIDDRRLTEVGGA